MKHTQLKDNHGRIINYVRLAVTDRCNLRCFYCMPEEGIQFLDRKDIMSYEEMYRLLNVLKSMGVDKIRITGGEPFVRKDIMPFLQKIKHDVMPRSFSITSNATLLHHHMEEIPKLFDALNISLDSLDPNRFHEITRRDDFRQVRDNISALIASGLNVKINAVVMDGKNIDDIIPFVEWTRNENIEVRFIEEMPFNGTRNADDISNWDYKQILGHIRTEFTELEALPYISSSTSMMYQVKGFKGKVGIIPAFSRTFCGTCNRIRITAKGELRTCLYSNKGFDLLGPMRSGISDDELRILIRDVVQKKEKNGFEAAKDRNGYIPIYESMTTIGG